MSWCATAWRTSCLARRGYVSPAKLCKKMQEVKYTWPDRHSNLQFTDGFSNEFSIFVGFWGGSSLGFAALRLWASKLWRRPGWWGVRFGILDNLATIYSWLMTAWSVWKAINDKLDVLNIGFFPLGSEDCGYIGLMQPQRLSSAGDWHKENGGDSARKPASSRAIIQRRTMIRMLLSSSNGNGLETLF